MIKLYDVVRIKDSGITGIVTDISSAKGRTVYTVENNKRGRTGIPGARNDDADSFAVFDCMKGKLEKVSGGEEYFFPSIGGWVWRYECCGNTWETTDAFENKGYFCPTCGELVTNRTLVRKGNEIMK